MNREAIYTALWERVRAIPGFATAERTPRHWDDVPAIEQPALSMIQRREVAQTQAGEPTRWRLQVELWLYVRAPQGEPRGPVINPLLDAVTNALSQPQPLTGRCTLPVPGVEWCRIEGTVETDEGALGEQAVVIVPITILST